MSVSPTTAPTATPEGAKPAPKPATPAAKPSATPTVAPRPVAAKPVAKPALARPVTPRPAVTARPTPPTPTPTAPAPARPAAAPAKPVSPWASLFRDWPAGIPQRGIVISQQGEATSFRGFMLRGEMVLLERISPDSLGARFLLLPFDEVAGVKFTDPLKQEVFDAAGFTGKLSS